MSWKDDKGLGPWTFHEQPNKWGYLNNPRWVAQSSAPVNYNGREDEEPQVWDPEATSLGGGTEHIPCGHWHKKRSTEVPFGIEIETYLELLNVSIFDVLYSDDKFSDVTYISTYVPFNTDDYDGTLDCIFEIVFQHHNTTHTSYAHLVDESDNVIATISISPSLAGPIGPSSAGGFSHPAYVGLDWYRLETSFTPLDGNHSYGLRVYVYYESGVPVPPLRISRATIRIRQTNASKSSIHIPMMTFPNGSDLQFVSMPTGYHLISTGRESIDAGVGVYFTDYDEANLEYDKYSQVRQIWKYDSEELSTLSRIYFEAAIGYSSPSPYTTWLITYGTPTQTWVHAGLCWSTDDDNFIAKLDGTFFDGSAVNTSGHTFNYIAGSEGEWTLSSDGVPWATRVYIPNPNTVLSPADGHHLYFCAGVDLWGGDGGDGNPITSWYQYAKLRDFSIPVGQNVTAAYLDYEAYYSDDNSRYEFKVTFTYILDCVINPCTIVLYDKTADAVVADSAIYWDTHTLYERKGVTIPAENLISGHEYTTAWKIDFVTSDWRGYPEVSFVSLYAHVQNITKFTSYYLICKGAIPEMNWWYEWEIYDDWGTIDEGYPYADVGTINAWTRGKLYLPAGKEVFFEACCYPDWYEEDYTDLTLVDSETDDNGVSAQSLVPGSTLQWTVVDGRMQRKRSEALNLMDGNRYVFKWLGSTIANKNMFLKFGFLIVKQIT